MENILIKYPVPHISIELCKYVRTSGSGWIDGQKPIIDNTAYPAFNWGVAKYLANVRNIIHTLDSAMN